MRIDPSQPLPKKPRQYPLFSHSFAQQRSGGVVASPHDDRALGQAKLIECVQDLAGSVIEFGNGFRYHHVAIGRVFKVRMGNQWRVHIGERCIDEERFVICGAATNEIDCLLRDVLVHERPGFPIEIVDVFIGLTLDRRLDLWPLKLGGIHGVGGIVGLVGRLADAPPFVEALIGRYAAFDVAKVPLTETGRCIPCV